MIGIMLISFITILVLLIIAYQALTGERKAVSARMSLYTQGTAASQPTGKQHPANWRGVVTSLSRYASSAPKVGYFDQKMQQAGMPFRGSEFMVLSIGISIIAGLLSTILTKGNFISGIIIGLIAYLISIAFVERKIQKRMTDMNNQLGDALALMANALRSGFSFLQAVEVVSREMTAPISEEFSRVLKEMNLGVTTEDALNNLTKRVRSDDLELVVTAVLIQRQVGGNLAQILDTIGTTIRERIHMKGEIKTLTAQGRLSGWIIGLLPVFLILIMLVINPKYISILFSDPIGRLLIGCAITGQVLGVIVIRRVVDIDM